MQENIALKKKKRKRWTRDDTELAILGLPTVFWFIIFSYLPMFGVIIAFKDFRITPGRGFIYSLFQSEWVLFDNFQFFLQSNTFSLLMRNTILYNVVFITLGIVLPVTLAILMSNLYNRKASKVYQTLMFFPYFLSWVVVSYFVFAFLNPSRGLANQIIEFFGGDSVRWYSDSRFWPYILIFMSQWKSIGYSMVIYLASITGMDQEVYESAMLDGASKFQQARYITLPQLKPIIIIMFILSVGRIFYSDFGLFWQVTQGVPNSLHRVAETFDTFIYKSLTQGSATLGRTAAASLFQAIACCITILLANFIVSKIDNESALI